MTKRHLLLSAAVMALMIGGTSPASAQYYRDYKASDKPAVEVDMGVLDGSPAPAYEAPGYVEPVEAEPAPLQPIAPLPRPAPVTKSTRMLKPTAQQPVMEEPEVAEMPAPAPAAKPYEPTAKPYEPMAKPYEPTAKPYRPYLTTPAPQPVPKPVVAKKYEPSPSVVDDASYKPDYSGYYKSGAAVPKAIAALEPAVAVAPAPKKDIAEQLTEELAPPPKLDPLSEIATERSIEQTSPPAKRMEPIISKPVAKAEYVPPAPTSKIVSMPPTSSTPSPVPSVQPARTPSKIISYPDSTVVTRPSGQPVAAAPALTPEPSFIPAVTPAEAPEQKIASLPAPQPKPAPVPARRPSLEILDTPPPEKPVQKINGDTAVKINGETAEAIVPPSQEEGKAEIAKMAEEVDKAAADMGAAPELPPLDEPPKFASVPTHSDLTLEFPGNSSDLTSGTQRKLDAIVRQMEDLVDGGRLQVRGYAAGEDGSKSSARRIALSRALSVRSYLMDKGVKAKRVDVRAMGSETDRNPLDRVDLIFQR